MLTEMDNSVSWKEFQSKLRKNGASTNYAVRQLLIAEYVNQEGAKQAETAVPSDNDATEEFVEAANDQGMFVGICKSMGIQQAEQNQRRGSMRRGSMNSTQRRGSMNSSTSSWNSFEGDNGLSIKELSQKQPTRRTSFAASSMASFSEQFNGEKRARRRASIEKLQGFDSIVNNVLDGYEESPTKPQFHRATKRMSLPSFGVPKRPSIVLTDTEGRSNSTGDPPSGEDFRELSAYLATFVDDSDDESDDDGTELEKGAPSPEVAPTEIETDGQVSRLSIKDEDILVDFPTRPRRLSSVSGSFKEDHGEEPSDSPEEVFEKPANWINYDDSDSEDEGDVEPSGSPGSTIPTGQEEEVYEKPANWINYDDSDSEDEDNAEHLGTVQCQYDRSPPIASAVSTDVEDDIDDESAFFKPPAFDDVAEPSYTIPLKGESSSRRRFTDAPPGSGAANPRPVRRRSCQSAAEFLKSDVISEFSSPTGEVQLNEKRMRRRGSAL